MAVGVASTAPMHAFEGGREVLKSFGLAEFHREWFPAGMESPLEEFSALESDGLGPLFNETSCGGCHRGSALAGQFVASSKGDAFTAGLVLRVGDRDGLPDPHYGQQIQTGAAPGVAAEGIVTVTLPDGANGAYQLDLRLERGPLSDGITHAALIAPSLVGRGAIERVDTGAIEALAAAQAARDDGIAGMVRRLPTSDGEVIGVYGYKSGNPSLLHQVSEAFSLDLGLSTPLHPANHADCTALQRDCLDAPHGDDIWRDGVEVSPAEIDAIVAYLSDLPAPAQASPDHEINPDFVAIGCNACHVRSLPAAEGGEVVLYSDLLLHDLGPDFDDGLGAPGVLPSQWRTAPLLALEPYPGRRYLHDGRASSLDTAIRAHGGEAAISRVAYESLDEEARQRLIDFLEQL